MQCFNCLARVAKLRFTAVGYFKNMFKLYFFAGDTRSSDARQEDTGTKFQCSLHSFSLQIQPRLLCLASDRSRGMRQSPQIPPTKQLGLVSDVL